MSCVIEGSGRPMAREGAEPPSEIRSACLAGADRVEQAIELAARGDRADEAVELGLDSREFRLDRALLVRDARVGDPDLAHRWPGLPPPRPGRGRRRRSCRGRRDSWPPSGSRDGWRRCPARGGVVVFHTGFEEFYGGPLPITGFDAIPRAFPRMPVVLAHANYRRVAEAFELVARHPGVDLDTVHVFGRVTGGWDRGDHAAAWAALREGLRAFPDRVMFGTDHPSGTGTLAAMYAEVRAFGLDPEVERLVLGGTAARLISPR